ncbi:hypothetical protein LOTGIDRAFT_172085 [Lottia gigantea]|uniref:Uncharacterized protein n=1 Tax=Lottia gigantea TaxID=225164 RepID=V4AXZ1_LOTGI|nr:hypothetical protein LOTGIDRAFT_172085 [Lottia gigantea]ESP02428.1 hypothetical protein LOTGIDRAFT_172085 [Lottia gigantea]
MKEFTRLNMEFEKLLSTAVTVGRLEIVRKRYFDICGFVTEIDDAFLPFVSGYIVSGLTTICLDIHALLYGFLSHTEVVAYGGIIGIATFELILILVNGSLIESKSKCCLETSKRFNMNKLNTETMSAFTLFLENMKNTDTGLSFLKLFIVDKTAMLTIAGTLISYIIVVLQMKPT